jgi:hypothetical protein
MRVSLQRALHARRSRSEEGVVALLTLIFLSTVGLLLLYLLFVVGFVSGAHTELYGATQSAAYASASEVRFGDPGNRQPPFNCQPGFDSTLAGSSPRCAGGRTARAAREVLREQLNGRYGLRYGQNVITLDEEGNPFDGVLAYEIALPPGAAKEADPVCFGYYDAGERRLRTCWTNPGVEGVQDFNYNAGVIVRTRAQVEVPACPDLFLRGLCRVRLEVSIPARAGQQLPRP